MPRDVARMTTNRKHCFMTEQDKWGRGIEFSDEHHRNISANKKRNSRVHNNPKVTTVNLRPASYYDNIRMRRPSLSIKKKRERHK